MVPARHLNVFVLSAALLVTSSIGFAKPPGGGGSPVNSAFVYQDNASGDLYLTNANGSIKSKLTNSGKGADYCPSWSPDLDLVKAGHQGWIAFFRQYDPRYIWGGIFIVPSDLSSPPIEIRSYKSFDPMPPSGDSLNWSPDGQFIVYASDFDRVSALSVATGEVTLLFQDPQDPGMAGYTYHPSLSPDQFPDEPGYQGFLAFSFAFDIALAPVEVDSNGQWTVGSLENLTQTADKGENHPVWSSDGQYLAFGTFEFDGSSAGRAIHTLNIGTREEQWVVDVVMQDVRPTWSPDGVYIGYYDAHQVAGKWTTDVFYVSPWTASAPVNVTRTASSSANERFCDWNPAWMNDLLIP